MHCWLCSPRGLGSTESLSDGQEKIARAALGPGLALPLDSLPVHGGARRAMSTTAAQPGESPDCSRREDRRPHCASPENRSCRAQACPGVEGAGLPTWRGEDGQGLLRLLPRGRSDSAPAARADGIRRPTVAVDPVEFRCRQSEGCRQTSGLPDRPSRTADTDGGSWATRASPGRAARGSSALPRPAWGG